ncbi:hypothetical protein [Glaciihabitans sp. UYNi722]|uniref:hypothetical protein n=1 Tax=Glaciihabitans sp. UYNi722 TaxID=3156344 RepID=UPI00339AB812
MKFSKLIALTLVALGVLVGVAGCSAPALSAKPTNATEPSIADYVAAELRRMPGVESATAMQLPLAPPRATRPPETQGTPGSSPRPAPTLDPWDAHLWKVQIEVILAAGVSPSAAATVAKKERALSDRFAIGGADQWQAVLEAGTQTGGGDTDTSPRRAASIVVYPAKDPQRVVQSARVTAEVVEYPGVLSFSADTQVPSIETSTTQQLADVYDELQKTAPFRAGADYWADGGRVRIADVPDHLTDAAVHAILSAASQFPNAQFWLQTPRDRDHWPVLYVAKLTGTQDTEIAALFSAPAMANANVSIAPLPYIITAVAGGAPSLSGNFGGG